jgi:hypothetical protein
VRFRFAISKPSISAAPAGHFQEPNRSHEKVNGGVLGASPARLGLSNSLKNLLQRRLAK